MTTNYNEFVKLLFDLTSVDKPQQGLVGGEDDDSNYAIQVPDDPNKIFVRTIDGDVQSAPFEAINMGVPAQPDYPVIIYYKRKAAYAVVDPERSKDYRGGNENLSTVPPHSHEPDFGNFDVVSTRRMREGQVIVTIPYSMAVTCTELKYFDSDGVEKVFYSDALDLTAHIPSDVNTQRYVRVVLNIDTGLLEAVLGEVKVIVVPLTHNDIVSIEISENQKSLAAVRLFNGMTVIDDDKLILDWRHWIQTSGSSSGSIIDKILTDENGDVLSDENGDVLTEE